MADSSAQDIAQFFDRAACCPAGRRRATGRQRASGGRLRGVSRTLLQMLDEAGLAGRTVLDAGCGQGGLTIALSQRGVAGASGIDLSSESIAAAQRAAEEAGVSAQFAVADAAVDPVEPHDVVVLDKVVCCYFDAAALLANIVPAARSVFAVSLPQSSGWRGAVSRLLIGLENGWRRLRRDPFRAFVHDVAAITTSLRDNGWQLTAERNRRMWYLAVFERRS